MKSKEQVDVLKLKRLVAETAYALENSDPKIRAKDAIIIHQSKRFVVYNNLWFVETLCDYNTQY